MCSLVDSARGERQAYFRRPGERRAQAPAGDEMAGEPATHRSSRWSAIRTPDQRLRVFVSSTLEELAAERAAARQAIERLRLTPVMFELGARPHPPRDLYRAYLDQSHIFVGIYGHRYGWIAPGETVSGLEDEYRLAGRHPKLLYLKRSAGARELRLEQLLRGIEADDTASYREFETAAELRELIENDLAVLLTERFEQQTAPKAERLGLPGVTNLPVPRNPLVGRDAELSAACDGTFLVMLEAIRDAEMVVPAIAEALRHPRDAGSAAAREAGRTPA
jgi:uncharacterized protein DUF4062